MAKITFADKKNFVVNTGIARELKITADDMNEIKKAVNDSDTEISKKIVSVKGTVETEVDTIYFYELNSDGSGGL